jgi:hypothetical protein
MTYTFSETTKASGCESIDVSATKASMYRDLGRALKTAKAEGVEKPDIAGLIRDTAGQYDLPLRTAVTLLREAFAEAKAQREVAKTNGAAEPTEKPARARRVPFVPGAYLISGDTKELPLPAFLAALPILVVSWVLPEGRKAGYRGHFVGLCSDGTGVVSFAYNFGEDNPDLRRAFRALDKALPLARIPGAPEPIPTVWGDVTNPAVAQGLVDAFRSADDPDTRALVSACRALAVGKTPRLPKPEPQPEAEAKPRPRPARVAKAAEKAEEPAQAPKPSRKPKETPATPNKPVRVRRNAA